MRITPVLTAALLSGMLAGCGHTVAENAGKGATTTVPSAVPSTTVTPSAPASSSGDPDQPTSTSAPGVPNRTKLPTIDPSGPLMTPPNVRLPEVTCPYDSSGTIVLYPENGVGCTEAKSIYRRWQAADPTQWSAPDGTRCLAYETTPTAGECVRHGKVLLLVGHLANPK